MTATTVPVVFHRLVLGRGIGHVYIRPSSRLSGNVERSHRIAAEESYRLLEGVVIEDSELFDQKLREGQDYHNDHRPTGSSRARLPTTTAAKDLDLL